MEINTNRLKKSDEIDRPLRPKKSSFGMSIGLINKVEGMAESLNKSFNEFVNDAIKANYKFLVHLFNPKEEYRGVVAKIKPIYLYSENLEPIDTLKLIFGNQSMSIKISILTGIIFTEAYKIAKHNVKFGSEEQSFLDTLMKIKY